MTMGIMSIYICAAIAYNLGKHYAKNHQIVRYAVDDGFPGGGTKNKRVAEIAARFFHQGLLQRTVPAMLYIGQAITLAAGAAHPLPFT